MLIDLLADRVPHLAEGELPGLLLGGQAVVGHTGLTEGFRHLRQMLFTLARRGRHA